GRPWVSAAVVTTPEGLLSSKQTAASATTARPSTRTSSPSDTRAASPATSPFTVTRPARISSSTARREPSPVEARNLLSLSGTLVGDQVQAGAERLVIVLGQLEVRELGKPLLVVDAEHPLEGVGDPVDDRRTGRVRSPRLLDQPPLQQSGHRRVGAHAADAGDLRSRHRLEVGDDGQRLE